MSGKGLDNVPIRWPDRWDPAFMDRLFREVLSKADIRNAIEGLGISITGLSDEFATLSASADVQALIDASLLTATNEASLDNVRRLIAGSPGITVTDNGAGSTLAIDIGVIPWGKLGPIPDLSVIGVDAADDGFDPVQPIQSSTNDTLLTRVSDALAWTTLTGPMLADVDTGDLAEGSNLYFTDERAQDAIGTILVDSSSIDFTYTDATPEITAVVLPAGVDHDELMNYVADQHVAHSGVNLTAGAGLTGGGTIAASRSFAVGAGTGITVNADDVALSASTISSLALADSAAQPGDNISIFTNNSGYLASVQAGDVDSEAATDGFVLTADGAGGAAWEAGGGGVSSLFDLSDVDADPNADRLAFWDDSDGALEWISEVPDGFLSSNVALLDGTSPFTANQAISGPANRRISVENTSAGTFVELIAGSSGVFLDSGAGDNILLRAATSGSIITLHADGSEIQYDATLHDFNGNTDISGSLQVNAASNTALSIQSTQPGFTLFDTDATSDEGRWLIIGSSDLFRIFARSDDDVTGNAFLTVSRTGISVDEIDLTATLLDFNGNLDANGTTMDIDGSTSLGLHGGSADISLAGTTAQIVAALLDFNGVLDVDGAGTHSVSGGTFQLFGSGETLATFIDDGPVTLYYDGASRLATSSAGMSLTGTGTATVDWVVSSDRRLKSMIEPITGALDKIQKIGGYTFLKSGSDRRLAGFIAQEIKCVQPESVIENENGFLAVSEGSISALLAEGIKEMAVRVKAIETRL